MSKLNPDEGKLLHKEASPTAQTVGNKLFGDSGVMTYRVVLQTAAGGVTRCDVDASTGDRAAELALNEFFGSKVMSVNPAPYEAQTSTKLALERQAQEEARRKERAEARAAATKEPTE